MTKRIYTASDMLEPRKEGYCNKDIAIMLGVSYQTVLRYIGAQGGRMQRMAVFESKPIKKSEEPTQQVEVYKPKAISEEYSIGEESEKIIVSIDHIGENIRLTTLLGGDICITYEQACELVQFLAWASRERCVEVAE